MLLKRIRKANTSSNFSVWQLFNTFVASFFPAGNLKLILAHRPMNLENVSGEFIIKFSSAILKSLKLPLVVQLKFSLHILWVRTIPPPRPSPVLGNVKFWCTSTTYISGHTILRLRFLLDIHSRPNFSQDPMLGNSDSCLFWEHPVYQFKGQDPQGFGSLLVHTSSSLGALPFSNHSSFSSACQT